MALHLKDSRWWFQTFFYFHPGIGEDSHFDEHKFQMGDLTTNQDSTEIFAKSHESSDKPSVSNGASTCCLTWILKGVGFEVGGVSVMIGLFSYTNLFGTKLEAFDAMIVFVFVVVVVVVVVGQQRDTRWLEWILTKMWPQFQRSATRGGTNDLTPPKKLSFLTPENQLSNFEGAPFLRVHSLVEKGV